MNTRKILSGGRVTISAALRKKYNIKPKLKIIFNEEGNRIKIFRAIIKE